MNYIFDASAIYKAVSIGAGSKLVGNYTISLARYELGNILWKEGSLHKRLSKREQSELADAIDHTLDIMRVLSISNNTKSILDIADSTNSSFYDAAYVHHSKTTGLTLVTEDSKLANKARNTINVLSLTEL